MALFTVQPLKEAATTFREGEGFRRTAHQILLEDARASAGGDFDIFLSHNISDADLVLGLKMKLNDYGLSVYVDWSEDAQSDRSKVNRQTAALLRERMKRCTSFIYAVTFDLGASKWMPWECGYFDAYGGNVAICPIATTTQDSYAVQEYLGLYPYAVEEKDKEGRDRIFIEYAQTEYTTLEEWLKGEKPTMR